MASASPSSNPVAKALWYVESHYADDAPFCERYLASFDPQTGLGGFEIWLPVRADGGAVAQAGEGGER